LISFVPRSPDNKRKGLGFHIEDTRMAADWYYEIDGQQHGPVSAGQLRQLATTGELQPSHLIWKEGMPKKVPAGSAKALFRGISATQDAPKRTTVAAGPATLKPAAGKGPSTPRPAPKTEEDFVEVEAVADEAEAEVLEEVVETVEVVEATTEKNPPAEGERENDEEHEEEPVAEMIAEAPITYRSGLPKRDGPIEGVLILETTGLRFALAKKKEIRIPFARIENVLEPAKGDFPPAMKSKALKSMVAGKAGKLAAGMVGSWLGGIAGNVTEKAGKEASKMAEDSGNLGKPPRNRITVFAKVRKERCKIYFDVNGTSRDEMNQEAKALYKQIQKARKKPAPAEAKTEPVKTLPASTRAPSPGGAPPAPKPVAAPTSAKPFRVMSAGKLLGPYSLQEIRQLLGSGKLEAGDMIGVETWMPVATLSGLLLTGFGKGMAAAGPRTAGGTAEGEDEVEDEELEEIEVHETDEDDDDAKDEAPAATDDEDKIPMDEEFKI